MDFLNVGMVITYFVFQFPRNPKREKEINEAPEGGGGRKRKIM